LGAETESTLHRSRNFVYYIGTYLFHALVPQANVDDVLMFTYAFFLDVGLVRCGVLQFSFFRGEAFFLAPCSFSKGILNHLETESQGS
jgi:hypothetical protein